MFADAATLERLAKIEEVELEVGAHDPDGQFCVMEAVAYVAGEPWSDAPACASPILGAFLRLWNDSLDAETRQRLKPYIPQLVGTAGTEAQEEARAWLAADWLVRECAPAWLRLAGLTSQAEQLESLAAVTSSAAARAAQPKLNQARKAVEAAARAAARVATRDAARDAAALAAGTAAGTAAGPAARAAAASAARDAARAAAASAARDAARAAAASAAWAAAEAAARPAARVATRDAARDAAGAALSPTTRGLQDSAFRLVDRMIAVKPGSLT